MLSRNEVKYIQSLYHKKNRDAEGLFIAEGVKIIDELLQSDFIVKKIYAVKNWVDAHQQINNITEVSEAELQKISNLETSQKVVAIAEKRIPSAEINLHNKLSLVLDGIQDPGNLGTIIRTADWFGVENIIASQDTADVYNAKVIQASMGSFLRVAITYTNLETFLNKNTIEVYGAMLNGRDIADLQKSKEYLLVIGNEGRGIRENIQPFIQQEITIPKFGHAESLNAAVATGIILWKLATG